MDIFWVVTLFGFHPDSEGRGELEMEAMEKFSALGIEEFSLSEAEVDDILGERSYSGGDLPQEVIDEVEAKVLSRPTNLRFFFDDEIAANKFYTRCHTHLLAEVQIEKQPVQDWNAEWKKHYAPILVNSELEIVPAWMKDYSTRALHKILINPGMGFGTGGHETTFLCLKLFTEEIKFTPSTVLDFGSGSGILGLSVLKFHPLAQVDFYDIDPEANKNCYHNAEINQLESREFRLLLPDYRSRLRPHYDLVFANILESTLLEEKSNLVSMTAPGGALILSGLLNHQASGVIEAYIQLGLELKKQLTKGDWSALLFVRPGK
jgi:ribosomal protein L11 methyltransferase